MQHARPFLRNTLLRTYSTIALILVLLHTLSPIPAQAATITTPPSDVFPSSPTVNDTEVPAQPASALACSYSPCSYVFLPMMSFGATSDYLVKYGQKTTSTSRRITLDWSTAPTGIGTYRVYRKSGVTAERLITTTAITPLGTAAEFAAFTTPSGNFTKLQNVFGDPTNNILATADQIYTAMTNANTITDTTLTQITMPMMSDVATALGMTYTDVISSGLGLTYTYRVVALHSDGSGGYTEEELDRIVVKPDSSSPMPAAQNLREATVYDGASDVGIIGTSRHTSGNERFDVATTQNYPVIDGTVFLTWDESSSLQPTGRKLQGYNVYRKRSTALLWQQINSEPVQFNQTQPLTTTRLNMIDTAYLYRDTVVTSPSDYTTWKYKVCPIDISGAQGNCSNEIVATARDLIPPSSVTDIVLAEDSDNQQVSLQWDYLDVNHSGIGSAPRMYVTRALTPSLELSRWSPVTDILATSAVLTQTYTVTTTQPLNQVYWYRVQVRDNAGNWSAATKPIKAAIYDRTPPTRPSIDTANRPCIDALPSSIRVPTDVRQVLLWRKITASGEFRLVRRIRPDETSWSATLSDEHRIPLPNTPVYYRLQYQDAYGNLSDATDICVRAYSRQQLLAPRFAPAVIPDPNPHAAGAVTMDFGAVSDIYSTSVVLARATDTKTNTVLTNTLNSASTTIAINPGESMRIGAYSSALTQTTSISQTINSKWVRNVNNLLGLDIVQNTTEFLDAPRHLTLLGDNGTRPLTVQWPSPASEVCRSTPGAPHDRVCLFFSAFGYASGEIPPPAAVFRRVAPASIGALTNQVPWMQVTGVVTWTKKQGNFLIEDRTIIDPSLDYQYVVVAHSSTSLEVIGYYDTVNLAAASSRLSTLALGVAPTTNVNPADSTCMATFDYVALDNSNKAQLPSDLYNASTSSFTDTLDLGNLWSFTISDVITSTTSTASQCPATVRPISTSTTNLYFRGALLKNGTAIASNVIMQDIDINAQGRMVNSAFAYDFDSSHASATITSATVGGLTLHLERLWFMADAHAVISNTIAITSTLPKHITLKTQDMLIPDTVASSLRSNVITIFVDNVAADYTTTTLPALWEVNTTYPSGSITTPVIDDAFTPWLVRIGGQVSIASDVSTLAFSHSETATRFRYVSSTSTADNNLAFTRPVYTSGNYALDQKGSTGAFDTTAAIQYTTAYPAALLIDASTGANLNIGNSRIVTGTLHNASVNIQYITADTDTSYARSDASSGKYTEVKANYLPIDTPQQFFYRASFAKRSITFTPVTGDFAIGSGGDIRSVISTTATIAWPGLSFTIDPGTLAATLYVAPAQPIGVGLNSVPKPVSTAWEQIDLGQADKSDLDPGINFNGNNNVSYACYGTGIFNADMDAHLRVGGMSEHIILNGLGTAAQNTTTGYNEALLRYSAIYVDNLVVDPSDIRTRLTLPYPADVTLNLQADTFDSQGCPVGGTFVGGGSQSLNFAYWNFDMSAVTWGYSTDSLDSYVDEYLTTNALTTSASNREIARNALPHMILQLGGDVHPMAATDDSGGTGSIPAVTEWLQNGDFGDVRVSAPAEVYVGGMPFTPSDVFLNRFYTEFMTDTSNPDTLSFADDPGNFPSSMLDGAGNLTGDSLKACADAGAGSNTGCGIQVLDGNSNMDYFGEPQPCTSDCVSSNGTSAAAASTARSVTTRQTRAAPAVVKFLCQNTGSVGSGGTSTSSGNTLCNPVLTQWVWDHGPSRIDMGFPSIFIANISGGILVSMLKSTTIWPGEFTWRGSTYDTELFTTDISVVVNGRLSSGKFITDVGIFYGYAASAAALRALATHQPNPANTGFLPYNTWSLVSTQITNWSTTLGYGVHDDLDTPDKEDPVDMMRDIWTDAGWVSTSEPQYQRAFDVLEPLLAVDGRTEKYNHPSRGVTSLNSDNDATIFGKSCTRFRNGQGAASFRKSGGVTQLTQLEFSSYIAIAKGSGTGSGGCLHADPMIQINRASMEFNSDGEIIIQGRNITAEMLQNSVHIDAQLLIGTMPDYRRIEGGLEIYDFEFAQIQVSRVGAVLGAGAFDGRTIAYIGFSGDAMFLDFGIRTSFLGGSLPASSPVLQQQYPTLMSKLGGDLGSSVYLGMYLMGGVGFPIINTGCALKVYLDGELRTWYLKPASSSGSAAYGGQIMAAVSGKAACTIGGRGQVTLAVEKLPNGGSVYGRTCDITEGCVAFSGEGWIAAGVGNCSPNTWHSWSTRWWNDSWCYTAGARIRMVKMQGRSFWYDPSFDYET